MNNMAGKKQVHWYKLIYYFFLILTTVIILVPIIWMLSASFDRINTYELPFPPRFIPQNPSLFNYEMVITNMKILRYIFNTVMVVLISSGLSVLIVPLAGFAFSKGRFPLKAFLLMCIMSSMMVPFESKILPIFNICKALGLSNTYLGIVLPSVMTNSFFIFLCKKAFDDLPNDLMESAILDGASKLRCYLQIYLPLTGATLATMAVLNLMNVWNDLLWPMIIVNKNEMSTIQVGLAMFSSGTDSISKHAGMSAAASMLSILPLTVAFMFLQRYIVQSIAVSGMKQ